MLDSVTVVLTLYDMKRSGRSINIYHAEKHSSSPISRLDMLLS